MASNKHELMNYYLIKKNYRISKIEDESALEEAKRKFSVRGKFFLLLFGFSKSAIDKPKFTRFPIEIVGNYRAPECFPQYSHLKSFSSV